MPIKDKEKAKIANRRYWEQHPGKKKEHNIKRKYGITVGEYDAIVQNSCGLCGTTEKRRELDHDHETRRIRGALCHTCNSIVGMLETKGEDWVDKAWDWIKTNQEW